MERKVYLTVLMVLLSSCCTSTINNNDCKGNKKESFENINLKTAQSLSKEVDDLVEDELNMIELNFLLKRLKKAESGCYLIDREKEDRISCIGLISNSIHRVDELLKKSVKK